MDNPQPSFYIKELKGGDIMITCKICGHSVNKDLSNHLRKIYDLSNKEYLDMYPDSEVCTDEIKALRRSNGTKTMTKYWNDEECRERHSARMTERSLKNWKGPEYRSKRSQQARDQWTPEYTQKMMELSHSESAQLKRSQSLSEYYNSEEGLRNIMTKIGGYREEYNNTVFRSNWEVILARFLRSKDINYTYEGLIILYKDSQGKSHKYVPDFYLPEYNLVIEVKPEYRLTYEVTQVKKEATIEAGYRYLFVTSYYISGIKEGSETIENELISKIINS